MSEAVIRVQSLGKTFIGETGRRVPVFEDLELTVPRGDFVCILGPTGCGKTTLLRMLTGLEAPSTGSLEVKGRPGLVFQQNALFPWLRVLENVSFPMQMRGMAADETRQAARSLLRLVRLEDAARAYPYELSGGMQQRAVIARALATDSEILLLDEPFGALDEQTRLVLQAVLLDLWETRKLTILFVTHNIEEALLLGKRILVLGKGRFLEEERVDLPRPRDRFCPQFVEALVRLRRSFAEAVASGPNDAGQIRQEPAGQSLASD